jgi:hypothetical protein
MPGRQESKEDSALISAAYKEVFVGCKAKDWSAYRLAEPLLTCWAVVKAQEVTYNGGFQYFFENDWPDKPNYRVFIDAFRRIGADEAAMWLEEAVDQFPFSDPHLHYERRREHLSASRSKPGTCDSVIDGLGNRLGDLGGDTYTKLAAYIRANIDAFPSARFAATQKPV